MLKTSLVMVGCRGVGGGDPHSHHELRPSVGPVLRFGYGNAE